MTSAAVYAVRPLKKPPIIGSSSPLVRSGGSMRPPARLREPDVGRSLQRQRRKGLDLTAEQKADLVQYLTSL